MNDSLAGWLARIEKLHPSEIELGLDRLRSVAGRLLHDRISCPVITVAGTNGKGSTVALIDALARVAGWRVGRYTSPHLQHFNERIVIDGEAVDDGALCQAFDAVEAARAQVPLTYFEFTTLAAFWLFQRAGLNLLVLEVGLGGRLDAVNLLDADVAVITSVGLDHQDWLGDTRDAIAREKAGVARAGRPLLYAEVDMPLSVEQEAARIGARLLRAGYEFAVNDGQIRWQGVTGARAIQVGVIPLGGDNLAVALQALALVDCEPAAEQLVSVAETLRVMGRCEPIEALGRHWVLDVGHNREALARLADRLAPIAGRTFVVCAMLADKPAQAILPFVDITTHWYLAALDVARGADPARLAAQLPAGSAYSIHSDVAGAMLAARDAAEEDDRILVFGSFYTVAAAKELLDQTMTSV